MRLSGDVSVAEEVCQEVFVRLWQHLADFRGESRFSTWLYSFASHVAIDQLRKQRKWWHRFGASMDDHAHPEVPLDNEQQLDGVILRLPEKQRWVFVLHGIEGYRHEDIASMLGIAVGTSKAHYHSAKQQLQEWLNEHQ